MTKKKNDIDTDSLVEEVKKLIKMRNWIDDNFPKFYKPYEEKFIEKAKDIGLNPYTLKACKREFELRFGINMLEWMLIHTILHFSAMRQAGVKSRFTMDDKGMKQIRVVIDSMEPEFQPIIERMMLLMWDSLELSSRKELEQSLEKKDHGFKF